MRRKKECSMKVVSERQTDSFAREIAMQIGGAKERGRLRGDARQRRYAVSGCVSFKIERMLKE